MIEFIKVILYVRIIRIGVGFVVSWIMGMMLLVLKCFVYRFRFFKFYNYSMGKSLEVI